MLEVTGPPVVCCDLDGVVWRGEEPIGGTAEAIAALRSAGLRVGYFSNNSSLTIEQVADKLARIDVACRHEEILTSALAAAELLASALEPAAPVLACAGPGVIHALESAGLTVVTDAPAAAVVVGWHDDFDFDGLSRASRAVREGARFVATNLDPTYPVPGGLLPGAGAIVAAVAMAGGREPEVAGKPFRPAATMVRRHLGERGIVVGDRPSTDGALADRLGWPFALVLSGVTARVAPAGGEAVPDPPPPLVGDDLAALVPGLISGLAAT